MKSQPLEMKFHHELIQLKQMVMQIHYQVGMGQVIRKQETNFHHLYGLLQMMLKQTMKQKLEKNFHHLVEVSRTIQKN